MWEQLWAADDDYNVLVVKVCTDMVDTLDKMIGEGRGDDEYKQLFTTMYVSSLVCLSQLPVAYK